MTEVDTKGKLEKAFDLDAPLDAIEDLPAFVVPPSGAYRMLLEGFDSKKINESSALQINFKILEVVELTGGSLNDGEQAPKEGDTYTPSFMMDNKFGVGTLKRDIVGPLAAHFSTNSIGDTLNAAKGAQLLVVIHRKHDDKKDRDFANIKKLQVL